MTGMFLLIGLLLLGSAFFSSSETALFSAPKARLQAMAKRRNRRAQAALALLERPRSLLATVLLGNNMVNIGVGVIMLSLGHGVASNLNLSEDRLPLVVLGLDLAATALILVFGEVTPKLLAARFSETLALFLAPPLALLRWVFSPVVVVFLWLSETILKRLGVSLVGSPTVTREEIETLVSVGETTGVLEPEEAEMVEGFFGFRERVVSEIMVPRVKMVAVSAAATVEEALKVVSAHGFSRYPVFGESIDRIQGILYAKDLLANLQNPQRPVNELLRPAYFVPETKPLADLLRELQQKTVHIAVVLDEYGGTHGVVTIEDLLEEIFGEIKDEYDQDETTGWTRRPDGALVVDAVTPLHEVADLMEVEVDEEEVDTVGGLVTGRLGRLPQPGEEVTAHGLVFRVLDIRGTRIQKVLVSHLPTGDQEQTHAS